MSRTYLKKVLWFKIRFLDRFYKYPPLYLSC